MKTREGVLSELWTVFEGPLDLWIVNSSRNPQSVTTISDGEVGVRKMDRFCMAQLTVDSPEFRMKATGKFVTWHMDDPNETKKLPQ